jgi:hypothetical protein
MFPFIYRRQTVQAQPGPRRGHKQTGSGGGGRVALSLRMEKTVAGQPTLAEWLAGLRGRWAGRETDRWAWRPGAGCY